jgi:hypothetical protein
VAWRSRRSRRCRCPCSGPAPSPDADGLLSSPRAAVEDVVLGVSSASRCVRAFPRLDAAATRLLALLTTWPLVMEGKPQRGWWLVRSGCGLTMPLNPGAAAVRAKAPIYPGLDRPGGRGGAGFPRARQAAGARREGGQKRDSRPEPGWVRAHARTGPSTCGPAGRGARPIPRVRGCGAGRLVRRIRGGERIR